MKLQKLKPYIKLFRYHRHMSGKIPNHPYKLSAVQISHPLGQYSPQLLLACSVTPNPKTSISPVTLYHSGNREMRHGSHGSHTSCTDITQLPNRAVLYTQNSYSNPLMTADLAQDAT